MCALRAVRYYASRFLLINLHVKHIIDFVCYYMFSVLYVEDGLNANEKKTEKLII